MKVATEQEDNLVQEPISLNDEPKKSESLDFIDPYEKRKRKENQKLKKKDSVDSDDEALVNLIARLKEKRQAEEKSAPKRVKVVSKNAVLP